MAKISKTRGVREKQIECRGKAKRMSEFLIQKSRGHERGKVSVMCSWPFTEVRGQDINRRWIVAVHFFLILGLASL